MVSEGGLKCIAILLLLGQVPAVSSTDSLTDSSDLNYPTACVAGACDFAVDSTCSCCSNAVVACADHFSNPNSACGEEAFDTSFVPPEQAGYDIIESFNCGWHPLSDVDTNNSYKWKCDECNNAHDGLNVESVDECVAKCEETSESECGGFAFFLDNTLGSNCVNHGSDDGNPKNIAACYFRNKRRIMRGFDKPGVTCYKRVSTSSSSED